jgi:hypothetical protein
MTICAFGIILFIIGGIGVAFLTFSMHYLNIFSMRFIKYWSVYILIAFLIMTIFGATLMVEYNSAPLWMW